MPDQVKEGWFIKKLKKRHRADPVAYDPRPLVKKLEPYALARIEVMEPTDFEASLDDATLRALSRVVPSAAEMFASVVNKPTGDSEVESPVRNPGVV